MARNQRLFDALSQLAVHLRRELMTMIAEKGLVATGTGLRSVDVVVREFLDRTVIIESHEFYMTFKDRGRRAGGKKVPIAALEEWLKTRNFSFAAGNIRGAAFAVQTNIFKFGIKPKPWLTDTLLQQQGRIEKDVNNAVVGGFDIIFDNMVSRAGKLFKGVGVTVTV